MQILGRSSDHIRILLAMQHEGRYNNYQLLKPETVKLMLTPYQETGADAEFQPSGVGLVWNLHDWDKPARSFDHGGAHMWGWTNWFIDYPELDLAIAVFMNQWSLPDDAQGARYKEARLIIDFVRSWVERERAGALTPVAEYPWAWKVSYVQGLMMVEYANAVLGIREPMSAATIDMMVRGAAPRLRDASLWDAAGFRAGVRGFRNEYR